MLWLSDGCKSLLNLTGLPKASSFILLYSHAFLMYKANVREKNGCRIRRFIKMPLKTPADKVGSFDLLSVLLRCRLPEHKS